MYIRGTQIKSPSNSPSHQFSSVLNSMKRKFSDSFKLLVVLESYSSKTELKALAEKYEIELRLLKAWRKSYKDLAVSLSEEQHSIPD